LDAQATILFVFVNGPVAGAWVCAKASDPTAKLNAAIAAQWINLI
jgi:hypothetical protein